MSIKYSDKRGGLDYRPQGTEKNPEFDDIDRKIIRALVADARLSFRDLGERVHLSPNATAERVRRLREIKVISGFHARVDRARLGVPLEAYIDIRLRSETSARSFEISAVKLSGVMTFATVTGEFDCRVRVACKDQADLMRIVEELRAGGAIQGTNTTVICREVEVRSTVY